MALWVFHFLNLVFWIDHFWQKCRLHLYLTQVTWRSPCNSLSIGILNFTFVNLVNETAYSIWCFGICKMFGHDRTWTCIVRDGTRTRSVQIRGLMQYPLCHALLYPLSYMAGSILLYEKMTSATMLQLALEPFLLASSPTTIASHWCWWK